MELIIAKYLAGTCDSEEELQLQEWLQNVENRATFDEILSNWNLSNQLFTQTSFDTNAAWIKVANAINVHQEDAQPKTKIIRFPKWLKLTSAAAILAFIIAILNFVQQKPKQAHLIADTGNKHFTLPDQSKIVLKKGSSLHFDEQMNCENRNVYLKGEADFKVAKNAQQPFIVHTDNTNIKVLGTQFDVIAQNNETKIFVNEGKVSVTNDANDEVILIAHQQAHFTGTQWVKDTLLDNQHLKWQTDPIKFTSKPLHEIVTALAAHTDAQIDMDATLTKELRNQKITVTFTNQEIDEMLNELCLISNTQWQKRGSKYIVRTK